MSGTLEIAGEVFWLAVIIGGGGWLFIHKLKNSEDPPKLIFKWIFTAVIIGFVFKVVVPDLKAGGYDAIFGLFLMLFCGLGDGCYLATQHH